MSLLKITVYSHKLFRSTKNGLQTDGAFPIQMDALAAHCEDLILCVPVISNPNFQGLGLDANNIHFHSLPVFMDRFDFMRKVPLLRKEILKVMQETDLGLVILPGYLGVLASYLGQRYHFPIFQWVVSDWSSNVMARRRGFKASLALILSPLMDEIITRLTRDVLTFFNGRILYGHHQEHHQVRLSSSISSENIDFHTNANRELSPPFRLLYVGRLSPEKGITYLLRAIATIESRSMFHLEIVGDGDLMEQLVEDTKTLSIHDNVTFHGYIPHGKQLRNIYRCSDVFILPALQDQQPKVLMEAMSQGLPVVATEVGGIPSIITHVGLTQDC